MQKLVEVRRRMGTVRSIRSIARTMATVAAAKLSRTRERAAGMREYTEAMRSMVQRQQAYAEAQGLDLRGLSPFLEPRVVSKVLLLHLSGDRGMCGAYNVAINRVAAHFVARMVERGASVDVIAKGGKGERYLARKTAAKVVEAQGWPRAGVTPEEIDAMEERLRTAFMTGGYDEVWCTYTRFYSPLRRQPRAVRLIPLVLQGPHEGGADANAQPTPERWFYEPDMERIVAELLAMLLRLQVEDVMLEAYASEQGARMITMEEATERADRTLHELGVLHNRLRREVITTDLIGVLFASRVREGPGAGVRG